jgi:GH24 family phage-related lysozyme (muramidase)
MRQPSRKALDLLQSVEELNLIPYDDTTGRAVKTWRSGATIGFGHLIASDEWPSFENGITQEEADALFLRYLAPTVECVGNEVHCPLDQNELDALVLLVFNIGCGAFRRSSVLKMLNDLPGSNYPTLEAAWKAFQKQDGKVKPGLFNRRACEWGVWKNGIYERW